MPAPVAPYAEITFTSRGGVTRVIAIDGVRQLTSPGDHEVLLGLFELLHGAIIVSESAAAVERSRSIRESNGGACRRSCEGTRVGTTSALMKAKKTSNGGCRK
jgi:hypothetical protein